MTRSENFILDFTHIYIDENIEQTENIVRIDCSDILETDLYCTKEAAVLLAGFWLFNRRTPEFRHISSAALRRLKRKR